MTTLDVLPNIPQSSHLDQRVGSNSQFVTWNAFVARDQSYISFDKTVFPWITLHIFHWDTSTPKQCWHVVLHLRTVGSFLLIKNCGCWSHMWCVVIICMLSIEVFISFIYYDMWKHKTGCTNQSVVLFCSFLDLWWHLLVYLCRLYFDLIGFNILVIF